MVGCPSQGPARRIVEYVVKCSVILGLGITGIGSVVLLTTDPSDGMSLGLLFVGFICSGAALFSLGLLAE